MGIKQRVGLISTQVFIYFYACTIASSPLIPSISQTTCSKLVDCCMRIWAEIRFQPDVGDRSLWPDDVLDCLNNLQSLIKEVESEQHNGLGRENVEYIIHLVDRIGAECEDAIESCGSEAIKKEFLGLLTRLWLQLRCAMVEV